MDGGMPVCGLILSGGLLCASKKCFQFLMCHSGLNTQRLHFGPQWLHMRPLGQETPRYEHLYSAWTCSDVANAAGPCKTTLVAPAPPWPHFVAVTRDTSGNHILLFVTVYGDAGRLDSPAPLVIARVPCV
jgi:hypothetical protein